MGELASKGVDNNPRLTTGSFALSVCLSLPSLSYTHMCILKNNRTTTKPSLPRRRCQALFIPGCLPFPGVATIRWYCQSILFFEPRVFHKTWIWASFLFLCVCLCVLAYLHFNKSDLGEKASIFLQCSIKFPRDNHSSTCESFLFAIPSDTRIPVFRSGSWKAFNFCISLLCAHTVRWAFPFRLVSNVCLKESSVDSKLWVKAGTANALQH